MAQVRDRALLLRRFPYGESSLVLQVLTRGHGRVHLIAKGVYRPTSRYYAALDLFDTLELSWSHLRGRELEPLSTARIATRRHRIARDPARFRAATSALELAATAAREGTGEEQLFDLLEGALERLLLTPLPAPLVQVEFELGFLQNLGLAPALGHCAACGRPAPHDAGRTEPCVRGARPAGARAPFSAGAGGRLCRACAEQARIAGRRVGTLPLDVLEAARRITETEEEPRVRVEVLERLAQASDAPGLERLRDFVARFVEVHLESRPRSYGAFLLAPNRNAALPGA